METRKIGSLPEISSKYSLNGTDPQQVDGKLARVGHYGGVGEKRFTGSTKVSLRPPRTSAQVPESFMLMQKDIFCVRAVAEFYRQGSQPRMQVEDERQQRGHNKISTDMLNSVRNAAQRRILLQLRPAILVRSCVFRYLYLQLSSRTCYAGGGCRWATPS